MEHNSKITLKIVVNGINYTNDSDSSHDIRLICKESTGSSGKGMNKQVINILKLGL